MQHIAIRNTVHLWRDEREHILYAPPYRAQPPHVPVVGVFCGLFTIKLTLCECEKQAIAFRFDFAELLFNSRYLLGRKIRHSYSFFAQLLLVTRRGGAFDVEIKGRPQELLGTPFLKRAVGGGPLVPGSATALPHTDQMYDISSNPSQFMNRTAFTLRPLICAQKWTRTAWGMFGPPRSGLRPRKLNCGVVNVSPTVLRKL
ncbi:hypothetical protein J6524_06905 [Bradyrhizobium sp. WSM 1738]|uniref:hypothetical protein n=1 Tax=Bradyrhizobium hereditatis TaxID=2821405 RepID=UPI001CE37FAD|nr:hypothetical protein [Bradyrhizobium hereditatis]MCA6114648.1 hypothetical protein [Bradyrhizobium hereditatis]